MYSRYLLLNMILCLVCLPQSASGSSVGRSCCLCGRGFSQCGSGRINFNEDVTLPLEAWDWAPQQSLRVRLNLLIRVLSSQLGWALVPGGEGCLFRLSLHWGQGGHASLSKVPLSTNICTLVFFACSQLIVTTFCSSVQKKYPLCQYIQRVVCALCRCEDMGRVVTPLLE